MTSTVSTVAPLPANGDYTSSSIPATGAGAVEITGTVFADQAGTLNVQQSFDNENWDAESTFSVVANTGQGFNVTLLAPYFRLLYVNGAEAQTVFRLYANLRDDEGNFVSPQTPSEGGEYVVLFKNSSGNWQYVGRFDGASGWDASSTAAVQTNASGTYAAFDVATGVVTNQTIIKSTEASATSF